MSYNGWKNYETWNVALWIDNEPATYEARREMARAAWEDRRVDNDKAERDTAVGILADSIKGFVESEMVPDLGACMASDLLNGALSEVDWYEIAENWIDDDAPEGEADEDDEAVNE